jgi:membrane-bound lytic murein transglycosylase A
MADERSPSGATPGWKLEPVAFAALPGWAEDDHAAAFGAFRLSAAAIAGKAPKTRRMGIDGESLVPVAHRALALGKIDRARARAFFEAEFAAFHVRPDDSDGFYTGYYEPEVTGSRKRTERYATPLYSRPPDLVDLDDASRPAGMDRSIRFARLRDGRIDPYPDRAEIEAGYLRGKGLELVWLADPIDAFYIHIQGSARVSLIDGGVMRVGFDGKSGQPYTPIGRVLLQHGALERGNVTMDSIRAWLNAHPAEAPGVMRQNRSFIFFREIKAADPKLGPVAAAGVQITAGRSLAVDRELHTFHLPVWVETRVPGPDDLEPFRRLMIAQDTGSAIVGPARGDIFFGAGDKAARQAGPMQASGRFVLLAPKGAVR